VLLSEVKGRTTCADTVLFDTLLAVLCPSLSRPQVYTIVTTALDGSSPPGRTAVCELLDKLSEPVPYLQTLFQPISSRVSQVWCLQETQPTMEACTQSSPWA
jgi:hypothetical protein